MPRRVTLNGNFLATASLASMVVLVGCDESKSKQEPPLVVGVSMMSQCPFANPALEATVRALEPLGDSVTLEVSYLGQQRDGRLFSIRGDAELTGDKFGLCAQKLAKNNGQARKFLTCQADAFDKIPGNWTACANQSGLPVEPLRDCAEGKAGIDLVRASFEANERDGVSASPTIRVDGKHYAGSRHSTAIAKAVCRALGDRAKEACAKVASPVSVPVTIITDARCTWESCSSAGLEKVVGAAIPGAKVKKLDFSAPEAQALTRKIRFLPVAVMDKSLAKDTEALELLGPALIRAASGAFALPSGTRWDPRAEICTDGNDNDGDEKVDCADTDCTHALNCRPERENSVTVFLDEGGQFSPRALQALEDVLGHTKRANSGFSVLLRQVGAFAQGKWSPLHGADVADEVRLQLCVQALEPDGVAAAEYAHCAARMTQGAQGHCLAPLGELAHRVRECAAGEQGEALTKASFEESSKVPVPQTPYLLVNNRYPLENYSPDSIATEVCRRNPGNTLCSFQEVPSAPGQGATTATAPKLGEVGP